MRKGMKPLMWLSFVDPDKPAGRRNLGVIVTRAVDVIDAVEKTHAMGINPGGEVLCAQLPDKPTVPARYLDRLLTRDEAETLNQLMMSMGR
jgi:hypothetical protein